MKVVLAKSSGFCRGVRLAVERARSLAVKRNCSVHTDGPLIHNEQMMAQLHAEGIVEARDPRAIADGILLVRAHGIPPARRRMLDQLPVTVIDATCPDVAKIQNLIRQHADHGYHVLIFGDPGHAEVDGLLGYAAGNGIVVSRPEDIEPLPDMKPVCLVSQSTQFESSYRSIAETARRRFPTLKVLDTICRSTKNRQEELLKIAKMVDAVVVVGGAHSANTVRLVQLASTVRPTFHIQTSTQLDRRQFNKFEAVGVTAGASTPTFIIDDVVNALANM